MAQGVAVFLSLRGRGKPLRASATVVHYSVRISFVEKIQVASVDYAG